MTKKESGDESLQEEEHEEEHEPDEHQEETGTEQDEFSEEECDEAIAELLATISNLESRIGQLEDQLAKHGIDYEHTPRRVEPGAADGDVSPDERHFYFRRIGR